MARRHRAEIGKERGIARAKRRRLRSFARRLRANATPAELLLKRNLDWSPLTFEFQKPLGSFVLDFYFPKRQLCVDVDGGYHLDPDQRERDARRSRSLLGMGIKVVRFTNAEVFQDPWAVVLSIYEEMTTRPLSEIRLVDQGDTDLRFPHLDSAPHT